MTRTKKLSDSELLVKAFEVISREGFESFTLEQVSKKTGLSPATFIKRFKTKDRLAFLARDQKWKTNLNEMQNCADLNLVGLKGIHSFIKIIATSVDSQKLGEHLRLLGTDADDSRSKKKMRAFFEVTQSIFSRLLKEAIVRKELSEDLNPIEFSILLEALVQGSIFQFAFTESRDVELHLKKHLTLALKPYRI